jgi:hypothetical protein
MQNDKMAGTEIAFLVSLSGSSCRASWCREMFFGVRDEEYDSMFYTECSVILCQLLKLILETVHSLKCHMNVGPILVG